MPSPDPFFAAADRIAYDFYTKLWRFVCESRATKALSSPRASNSMYWYEYGEKDTGMSILAAHARQNLTVLADEFRGNSLSVTPGSKFLPVLEKYRSISKNHGLGTEPMIIEVILRFPQPSTITKAGPLRLTSSQAPRPIILETWKISLTCGQGDGLMGNDFVHHLVRMYEERRKFYLAIHICINKLPTGNFIGQVHDSSANLLKGLKIALRLSSGSANEIEKQFTPYGQL